MNNIEQNALRIAELKYPLINGNCPEIHKENLFGISKRYKSYNGLMPIVFECNSGVDYGITVNWSVRLTDKKHGETLLYAFNIIGDGAESFINALQLAVIKYLELKNG